jgi:carboxyl-terminal processing protease
MVLSVYLSVPVFAQVKSQEEYWSGTQINFESLKLVLKTHCNANVKSFVGCVQGLNVMARFLSPAQILVTEQEATHGRVVKGERVKGYGPLTLYNLRKLDMNKPYSQIWTEVIRNRELQIAALEALYNDEAKSSFDIGTFIDDLKSKVLVGKWANSEALITADIFNAIYASSVDPHTRIQPIEQFKDQMKSADISFTGIGAIMKHVAGKITIITPLEGSPALEAGLKARDVVEAIDGVAVAGIDFDEVSEKMIKGEEGTEVKIDIMRDEMPLSISITRRKIVQENVESKKLIDRGLPLGYIKVGTFMEANVCDKVRSQIIKFNEQAKGLILDLRGNPGGLLLQATCIGSLFVGQKIIARVKNLSPDQATDLSKVQFEDYVWPTPAITDLPLVTLIDAGSASASEIVAGALQDYKRSWIAGDRSFGKATAQMAFNWTDSIILWKTIQRFYQPTGRTNQIVGIVPDFYFDPAVNATDDDKFALREADSYTNALPPTGPTWVQPRGEEVTKLSKCIKTSGIAKTLVAKRTGDAMAADYQLLQSEDLMACAVAH